MLTAVFGELIVIGKALLARKGILEILGLYLHAASSVVMVSVAINTDRLGAPTTMAVNQSLPPVPVRKIKGAGMPYL